LLAAVTVRFGFTLNMALAVPTIGPFSTSAGFICEFIGTYAICLCVVAVCDMTYWKIRPAFVGGMYAATTFAIGPITSACFNPFLILGASIVAFFNNQAWIFCVAPVVGSIVAALMVYVLHLHHIHSGPFVEEPKKK
jgi:glycerol uptake facilitator-like aquaporin